MLKIDKLQAAEVDMQHQRATSQDFLPPIYDFL